MGGKSDSGYRYPLSHGSATVTRTPDRSTLSASCGRTHIPFVGVHYHTRAWAEAHLCVVNVHATPLYMIGLSV